MTRVRFTKGHGTLNDFVLIADTRGHMNLGTEQISLLADRRKGIGADGVIRLVPTTAMPERREILAEDPEAIWFMDYRNADGSIAEMCGNGIRVFAAFASRLGLIDLSAGREVPVGTRAGVKYVRQVDDGWYAVDMGHWSLPGGEEARARGYDAAVLVRGGVPRPALSVDLGNPHVVVAFADTDTVDRADLSAAPAIDPEPEHGANVELVVPLGEERVGDHVRGRVRMRVFERGVGETPSCGTGACAAALAVRAWGGSQAPDDWRVEVPGGVVGVRVLDSGSVELSGPATLVYSGEFELPGSSQPVADVNAEQPAAAEEPADYESVDPATTSSTR